MSDTLHVYLYDNIVGQLTRHQGKLQFSYDRQWLDQPDAQALSISLPLRKEPFDDEDARSFFAGLLPEGTLRKLLMRQFQLSDANTFGLLNEIGGECAGAVSFHLPGHRLAPANLKTPSIRWLDNTELHAIIVELPKRPMLAGDQDMRLSLAGAQDKLPVVFADGRIGLALNGQPSTHILKPAIPSLQGTVINEAFCLMLANESGLDAAQAVVYCLDGTPLLLVKRYDRHSSDASPATRLHQEDFCQALGRDSDAKYQHEGGPNLGDCVSLLRSCTRPSAPNVLRFIDYVLFNALIGNHDAHAKNFSLLYANTSRSTPVLSPLYDALSTAIYPELSNKMAMKIGSQYTFNGTMPRHWQRFAEDNQLSAAQLQKRLLQMANRLPKASQALASRLRESVASPDDPWLENNSKDPTLPKILALIEKRCSSTVKRIQS